MCAYFWECKRLLARGRGACDAGAGTCRVPHETPNPNPETVRVVRLLFFAVQMVSFLLNLVMFEDCKNQWSVSRPLLGLILLQEQFFEQVRHQHIASAPPQKQELYHQCFTNLMNGVERVLSTKNRDRFTQNLAVFRRDLNNCTPALCCCIPAFPATVPLYALVSLPRWVLP